MTGRLSSLRTAVLAVSLCLVWAGIAHAQMSVQEFSEQFQNGPEKLMGRHLTVEGRVSTLGHDSLRFLKCEARFQFAGKLGPIPKAKNVQVTGMLAVDNRSKYVFVVQGMANQPTDHERFQEMRQKIRANTPAAWYELGQWGRARSDFYKDVDLANLAREADERGVNLERRQLPQDDGTAAKKLAERAASLNLTEMRQRLVHESLVRQRQDWLAKPLPPKNPFSNAIRSQFPAAKTPLREFSGQRWQLYLQDPLETYDAANDADRKEYQRMLYVEARTRELLASIKTDKSNSLDVAQQIEDEVPEKHAVAQDLRAQQQAKKGADLLHLSRAGVLELARDLEEDRKSSEAEKVKENWIAVRREQFRRDDIEELLALSEDCRMLFPNRPSLADEMLLETIKLNPDAPEVRERLERREFRLVDGAWLSPDQFAKRPEAGMDRAIREGRAEVGMTSSQLQRALGPPQEVSRLVGQSQIDEIWSYHQSDASRMMIRLQRRPRQADAVVLSVQYQRPIGR